MTFFNKYFCKLNYEMVASSDIRAGNSFVRYLKLQYSFVLVLLYIMDFYRLFSFLILIAFYRIHATFKILLYN